MRAISAIAISALLLLAACGSNDNEPTSSGAGGTGGGATTGSGGGATTGSGGGATTGSGGSSTGGGGPGLPCALNGVQHPPNAQLSALNDGESLDLGAFPCTVPMGDGYACEQVTDYSGMVYDCKNHGLLLFGGGHATTFTDTLFAFHFDTLAWSELYAPTPCTSQYMGMANFDSSSAAWLSGPNGPYPRPLSRHTYDLNIYVDTLDEFLLLEGPNGDSGTCPPGSTGYTYAALRAKIAHYDMAAGSWSFSAAETPDGHPDAMGGEYPAAELDPVSGLVVILGSYGLYLYDPVARTKTVALDNYNQSTFPGDLGYANHLVYFPPNDRFYYFDRGGFVWEVVLNRTDPTSSTVSQLPATGPAPSHYEPGYAYDPVHKIIGGAITNDMFYAFDPATNSWSSRALGGNPGTAAFHAVSYDPVDNVFLFVTEARHTWAYRYAP